MEKIGPMKPAGKDVIIWLVEDNERFRANIKELLDDTEGFVCELALPSCEDALRHLETDAAPDLMLMDIDLPGIDGIEGVQRIKSLAPSVQVIMLTVFDEDEKIFRAICGGASGYLLKSMSPAKIVDLLKEILTGGAPINSHVARKVLQMFNQLNAPKQNSNITPAETRILVLLAAGEPKKRIANELGLSFYTVDNHLRNIYAKLHVHTQGAAVAKALKDKLV